MMQQETAWCWMLVLGWLWLWNFRMKDAHTEPVLLGYIACAVIYLTLISMSLFFLSCLGQSGDTSAKLLWLGGLGVELHLCWGYKQKLFPSHSNVCRITVIYPVFYPVSLEARFVLSSTSRSVLLYQYFLTVDLILSTIATFLSSFCFRNLRNFIYVTSEVN